MYSLDFETMIQVMQAHQKTGFLYADVPSGVASLREPCRVEINIKAGNVISCSIIGNSGRHLTGKEATRELSRVGRLNWTFTPQEQIVTQPAPPILTESFFPVRTVHLEQWQMRDWPRIHRMVFALADGTKSIAKIAEVLSVSQYFVEKTLRDLQSIGVIAMEPQNGKSNT
jgi:biotin operon repressor